MATETPLKRVLIYCRESRDDGFANYERIETQRDILVDYCNNKRLGVIVGILMDDNKSGTDFERLNPVKERIRRNEVDILLLKDASRMGRNILESLRFTAFLESYKVELLFESERYDEDLFPLIAWFNERRAKDDSMKIRRVLKHKMEEGALVIRAPYGYRKDRDRLLVDGQAAAVVREIFDLYLKGFGQYEIAALMNQKGCPTPSERKSQYENTNRTAIWNAQHIRRILTHMAYSGDMPYGMRKKVSFKSKKYQCLDPSEWIIRPNHHEAIVPKPIFAAVQQKLQSTAVTRPRHKTGAAHIFSGLLYCGRCGSRLYRKTQLGKTPWYSCCKSDREGTVKDHIKPNYGCRSHRLRESVLTALISDYIIRLVTAPESKAVVLNAIQDGGEAQSRLDQEIAVLETRINALKAKASKVYDDQLEGRLPDYLFDEKIAEITTALQADEARLCALRRQAAAQKPPPAGDLILALAQKIRETGINRRAVILLFEKLIVYDPGEIPPDAKERYVLSTQAYDRLWENGGLLLVQNFADDSIDLGGYPPPNPTALQAPGA